MTISTESAPDVSAGSGPVVRSLSLLVPGSFTDDDPYQGLESTLRLFEYAERLGFDGAWIRQQHLVPNVSSAASSSATRIRSCRIRPGRSGHGCGRTPPGWRGACGTERAAWGRWCGRLSMACTW